MTGPRIGELCAGYGGLSMAVTSVLGGELAWVADNDPGAATVLAHRHPGVPNLGDITTTDWGAIVKAGNHKLDDEQKREAAKLYDAGFSIGECAAYFGVTRQAMWSVLRRRTTMRPQPRYGKDNHFYRGGSLASDRAHNITEQAIARGILARPARCGTCGSESVFKDGRAGIQAHHPDYNKPLDVMWLCQPCHHRWHAANRAVPLRGGDADGSLADIDVITAGFP